MARLSLIRFRVKPGRSDEFLRLFREAGMLTRPTEIAGFASAELAVSPDGGEFIVVARWKSEDAYAQWQDRSLGELSEAIVGAFLSTLEEPRPGALFDIIDESDTGPSLA